MLRPGPLLAAGALLALLIPANASAQSAPGVVSAQVAADADLLSKIFAARTSGFADLRGGEEQRDHAGHSVWSAAISPFRMSCKIVAGPEGSFYRCTNTGAVATPSQPGEFGGDTTPKSMFDENVMSDTRLSPSDAGMLTQAITTALETAEPDLHVYQGFSITSENQETLFGLSAHQYLAAINVTTLATNGEENSARVTLTIFSQPLARDPSQT